MRSLLSAFVLLGLVAAPAFAQDKPVEKAGEKPAAEKAAKPEDAKPEPDPAKLREEAFARGKRAYDRGDWLKAILDLRPLAEWNDVRAMMLLGNMYANGNGVGKDVKEAFQLYHRAAVSDKLPYALDGMVATASMYQTGLGINVNTRLAIGWFERAAKLGSQSGAFFYAIHLFQGSKGTSYDLKADQVQSYLWFRIAATHGDDKKLRRAAYGVSEKLAARLPPDKVIEMNTAANDWAPNTLADIGPNPEDLLVQEMEKNGKTVDRNALPEEKPEVAPKPEKDDGESLVPPN